MQRGRPKGAKNVNTVWREAEKLLGDDTAALQMVDPLTQSKTGREAHAPLDKVRRHLAAST